MSNRYCNLTPSKQIKDDFGNITLGFDGVQNEMDGRIATDQSLQTQITSHLNALVAHAAAQIQLMAISGMSATDLQAAIAELSVRIANIVAGSGSSNTEIVDARMGADSVARATLGTLVREIHARLLTAAAQSYAAKHGLNYLLTDQASPLEYVIKGLTLVNRLGKDGNCDSASKFGNGYYTTSDTVTVDSANAYYGANALKVAQYPGTTNFNTKLDFTTQIDISKYYLIAAMVKNGTTTKAYVGVDKSGGGITSSKVNTGQAYSLSYLKVSPSDLAGATYARLGLYFECASTSGNYGFADGLRVYEIDQATYSLIDIDPNWTGSDNIEARFPYVDGVKHMSGTGLRLAGKNLLPPFTDWTLHANALVTDPYTLTLNATAANQFNYIDLDVVTGKTYTLSGGTTASGQYGVYGLVNGSLSTQILSYGTGARSFSTSTFSRIRVYTNNTSTGSITFSNPQLELGSAATEFSVQNNDYAYVDLKLASNVDRSVVDTIDSRTGTVTRRWKTDVALDGLLAWGFDYDGVGWKGLLLPLTGAVTSNISTNPAGHFVEKYDGNVLGKFTSSATDGKGDTSCINQTAGFFYINIFDANSGWTESLNPNSNAIKALMNGWKANGNNGSVYNSWVSALDGSAPTTNTEAWVAANKAPGWSGWATLSYQLAAPDPQTVVPEGSLSSHNGGNQLEVLSGIIDRELATPRLGNAGDYYSINVYGNSGYTDAPLSRRVNRIFGIYKNGKRDLKWTIVTTYAYGNQRAYIAAADYDPTAEYTVTYQALDRYLLTTNPVDLTLYYNTNPKTVLDSVVRNLSDAETQVSIHDRILADHTARLLALEA